MSNFDVYRMTKKVSGVQELHIKNYDVKSNEQFNLGLNFRQRIANFALGLSSDFQFICWDEIKILIYFKDDKKLLFQAKFEVLFYKDLNIIYSVKNIKLKKHTYKPFII